MRKPPDSACRNETEASVTDQDMFFRRRCNWYYPIAILSNQFSFLPTTSEPDTRER
jgi:hypothetical protein